MDAALTPTTDARTGALTASAKIVRGRCRLRPQAAIILGSGLGGLADAVEHPEAIAYTDLPALPPTTAAGHAGRLILGYLDGLPVAVFAGRSHLYEGHDIRDATAAVRLAHALGADLLIASNAAGGLNPRFCIGEVVAIDSHIDLFFRRQAAEDGDPLPRQGSLRRGAATPYDAGLIAQCESTAISLGFALPRGTYLGTLGPTYETRAEYRAFRALGADMVGMSTVAEVLQASRLGMRTLAFSVITNAANPDRPSATTHQEVLDVAAVAQRRLLPLLRRLCGSLAGPPD